MCDWKVVVGRMCAGDKIIYEPKQGAVCTFEAVVEKVLHKSRERSGWPKEVQVINCGFSQQTDANFGVKRSLSDGFTWLRPNSYKD